MPIDPTMRKMLEIFFCYSGKEVQRIKGGKKFLAHYTTADTAMKVIKGRSLWLRNAAVMNDYSEIDYGKSVMAPVLESAVGERYRAALDAIGPGLADNVMRRHRDHASHARETVFTASLSEHDPDDEFGRLSMWRAYGGPVAGVALLFHGSVADLEIEASPQVAVSPVLYGRSPEFTVALAEAAGKLEGNRDFLKSFDPQIISNAAATVLQFAMFSIKHPGFTEEREWRIIHRPYEFSSASVLPVTHTLGGVPQTVYEFPFHHPEKGAEFSIPQLALNEILAGVMLGPCAYPETVFRAFKDEMTTAGIEDAEKRIFVSNIPLRQRS